MTCYKYNDASPAGVGVELRQRDRPDKVSRELSVRVFRANLSGRFLCAPRRRLAFTGYCTPSSCVRLLGISDHLSVLRSLDLRTAPKCRRTWTRSRRRLSTPPATRFTSMAGLPPPRPSRSSQQRDRQKQGCSGARLPSPGCPTWRVLFSVTHAERRPSGEMS